MKSNKFFPFLTLGLLLVPSVLAQTNQGQDFWTAETTNLICDPFAISIANPSGSPANVTIDNVVSGPTVAVIPSGNLQTFTFPCQTGSNCSMGNGTDIVPP